VPTVPQAGSVGEGNSNAKEGRDTLNMSQFYGGGRGRRSLLHISGEDQEGGRKGTGIFRERENFVETTRCVDVTG